MSSLTLIAHAGHWLTDSLYVLPALVVLALIATSIIRQRRQQTDE
ncbi:MAG: hypothetical protein ACR2N5_04720 [Solirubrobacterales bacterium]